MDSALRPREIQARIRAGESPDEVARAADVPVERIEPYAGPVLAERDHMASLARQHPVRRRSETTAHRLLGATVTEGLLARGVQEDTHQWDAWKLGDRRWRVRVSFEIDEKTYSADFLYDQTGHFSVADNDTARSLIGDDGRKDAPHRAPATDDELAIVRALQPTHRGRPTPPVDHDAVLLDSDDAEDAFHEGELEEIDGVYEIVQEPTSNLDVLYDMLSSFDEDSVKIYSGLVHPLEDSVPIIDADPGEDPAPAASPTRTVEVEIESVTVRVEEEPEQLSLLDDVKPEPEQRPRPRSRKKRASVPSWDEIMFGGPKDSD